MADEVVNKIYLTIDQDKILQELKEKYNNDHEDIDENVVFDFNYVVPRPETLERTVSPENADMLRLGILQAKADGILDKVLENAIIDSVKEYNKNQTFSNFRSDAVKSWIKEDVSKNVLDTQIYELSGRLYDMYKRSQPLDVNSSEEMIERSKELIVNLVSYQAASWYDWSVKNWGTKWNAVDDKRTKINQMIEYEFITAWDKPEPVYQTLANIIGEFNTHTEYENGSAEEKIWTPNKKD